MRLLGATLVALAACAGTSRAPEIVAGSAPEGAVVVEAGSLTPQVEAGITAPLTVPIGAGAPRCSGATDTDAGVLDVFLSLEPVPRSYAFVRAVSVVIPALRVEQRWRELEAPAAATCASTVATAAATVECHSFETTMTLGLEVTDGALVGSSTLKSYDGTVRERPFAPILLPCGATVVIHGLGARTPRRDCFSGCGARRRACLLDCARRLPSRGGALPEAAATCDAACASGGAACVDACAPR